MKKFILILTLFIAPTISHAQVYLNCVKNGGFEELFDCNAGLDMVNKAKGWSAIDSTKMYLESIHDSIGKICSPEVCHSCIPFSWDFSVPSSSWYIQNPRSGEGMAHLIILVGDFLDTVHGGISRDYLQGRFWDTLESGKEYCVTYYTVITERSNTASNNMGAYLDDGSIDTTAECGWAQTHCHPQVYSDTIINSPNIWRKVSGTFVASGNERFITIGNFQDGAHTDTMRVVYSLTDIFTSAIMSYYLIDDVSVLPLDAVAYAGVDDTTWPGGDSVWIGTRDSYLPCRWYSNGALIDSGRGGFKVFPDTTTFYVMELDVCGTLTYDTVMVYVGDSSMGIALQAERQAGYTLYPNPAQDLLHISRKAGTAASIPMQLYDGMGRVVQSGMLSFKGNEATLNTALLPQGIYLVRLNGVSLRFMKE